MNHYSGIVRFLDPLGRIVIPAEVFRYVGIKPGREVVALFIDEEKGFLAIHRHTGAACFFCSSMENLLVFKNRLVCSECKSEMVTGAGPVAVKTSVEEEALRHHREYQINEKNRERERMTILIV